MESATANSKSDTRKDVYEIITGKIIDQLDKGVVPWRRPWAKACMPTNLISKRPYRGINAMLLGILGYEDNFFLTSKQLKEIGGSILPEEKPHMVVFWNFAEKDPVEVEKEEKTKKDKAPFLRYYTVYNIAQCAGIAPELIPTILRENAPIPACEDIVKKMLQCPDIKHKDPNAYYDCLEDYVNMPKMKAFESPESYYSTLFHELVHSTGHHTRLDRAGLVQMSEFGSEPNSQEELIAEIATCYLQSVTGITSQFEQSAAYIQSWLKKLRNDKYFILTASSQAQKAVDFILNIQLEDKEHNEE